MSLKNIYNITKKELRSYFDSPRAYIILVVFLLLWEFLFFRSLFLVNRASVADLFYLFPWLCLFLLPALTMGAVSEEKSRGTLEFLLTQPIGEQDLILGKFLACFKFAVIALLLTLPIALSLSGFGDLDWGVVLAQYLAGLLFAGCVGALGILISSLFKSQIASLILTIVSVFLLLLIGTEMVAMGLPFVLGGWLRGVSLSSHFNNMLRGVIDLRDVWYFVSLTALFLFLAYFWVKKERLHIPSSKYHFLKFMGLGSLVLVLLSNALGAHIPGRLDVTQNQAYTLSQATKRLLGSLEEPVEITLFASQKLPPQFAQVLRETKDILADYQTQSGNQVKLAYKNPGQDPEIAKEARDLGIPEMQFNVVAEEEFKIKKGYLGLAVQLKGASTSTEPEVIPFINSTNGLEYQLSSFIQKLARHEKKKVVFLSGEGEKRLDSDYRILGSELKKQFQVETLSLTKESSNLPTSTDVLVVAAPINDFTTSSRASIDDYLEGGGSALFLIDGFTINPQGLSTIETQSNIFSFLKRYGVEVQKDIVYDLKSKATISFGTQFFNIIVPYPFWPRALSSQSDPLSAKIKNIVLTWPSSVSTIAETLEAKNLRAETIFQTTEAGGRQTEDFDLDPQKQPSTSDLKVRPLAVKLVEQGRGEQDAGMRFLVVGESDFLTDMVLQQYSENLAFGIEAIAWLAQEDSLAGIQLKSRGPSELLFDNPGQKQAIKYGNLAFVVVMPLAIGAWRFLRRRRLERMSYQ